MSPLDATLILIIGTVVGLLPGLFGVGGAFLMVPALNLLAHVPLDIAIGSSACQVLGPATTGVLHRRATGTLYLQLPLTMLGGTFVGVWLGMLFVDWAGQSHDTIQIHGRSVPRLDTVMMFGYFLLLLVAGGDRGLADLARTERRRGLHRGHWEDLRMPPWGQFAELDGRTFSIPILTVLATLVGFLNSGLGMGGGILLVPALVSLVGLSTHRAMNVSLDAHLVRRHRHDRGTCLARPRRPGPGLPAAGRRHAGRQARLDAGRSTRRRAAPRLVRPG